MRIKSDAATIMEVDSTGCIELLNVKKNLAVIDVRTSADYAISRLPGAANIDILSSNAFESIHKLQRERPYLVYCDEGVRSKSAVKIMKDMGFKSVYFLINGLSHYRGSLDRTLKKVK